MEFENYPSIVDVQQSILKLNKVGFPKFNEDIGVDKFAETVSKMLTAEFGILPNFLKPYMHKEFSLKFFRTREIDTISNINLIREHSYPPINLVRMGRCNFPKFPVFYCSDNPMTALIEVIKDNNGINKKFCVSKWELIESEEQLVFESFLQTNLPDENQYNFLKENLQRNINTPFIKSFDKKLDKDKEEGILEYLKYLDTSFILDKDYSLSACLAYRSLYAEHNFRTDILLYPSVQSGKKGINMALNPNFVENSLKLTRLYVVEINNYNKVNDKMNIAFYKYAEVEKNVIMWTNVKPNDEHFNDLINQDFGNLLNGN
jgi:hypothetical protein